MALGGEAGARLAARIAISTSADTLLRMATTTTTEETVPPEPRVIAVDDWAWRRGHSYGTILVDLERNQVIDLLPDRQAGTLAIWLRKHPSIEIIARDRAGAYADGARQGAPQAAQVADRWHMLRNLGDAVRAVVDRQHRAIRVIAKEISEERTETTVAMIAAVPATVAKPSAAVLRSQEAYARRRARYEEAVRLKEAGVSLTRIAALMGAERKTIRNWLRSGGAALWKQTPGAGVLTPYHDVLHRRWSEGCRNAALLWRELVDLGFSGRPGTVQNWAGQQRKSDPKVTANPDMPATLSPEPSARQTARMLMADPTGLSQPEQTFVSRVLAHVPDLVNSITVAKRLSSLLRRKSTEDLEGVLAAAANTSLTGFAAGLRRDIGAVQASLDLPWTTSPAEGQINRLKMLKRTMYGRAGFALLRARVLDAA